MYINTYTQCHVFVDDLGPRFEVQVNNLSKVVFNMV